MTEAEFDFHSPLSRWDTHSAKWDLLAAPLGRKTVALSVADMEFRTAPAVIEAVETAAKLGSYGYTEVFDDFRQSAANWQHRRHGWTPDPHDCVFFPRIVQCVAALVHLIIPHRTGRPARVVTLTPAYHPFLEVCEYAGASIESVELLDTTSKARIDFEALESAMTRADLFLFTHPHNPSGRVWSQKELEKISAIARAHDILILSDDIHADFTRSNGVPYLPLARISPDLWQEGRILHCTSPSKTFTIAGLEASAIFARGQIIDELEKAKRQLGLHNPNYFAIPAAIAAWNYSDQWVDALQDRIDTNIRATRDLLATELPEAHVTDPEGTYLLWVDARPYAPTAAHLEQACRSSRVLVTPGQEFGTNFEGFFRINTAMPLDPLLQAVRHFSRALIRVRNGRIHASF